jgi:hypothetical protein
MSQVWILGPWNVQILRNYRLLPECRLARTNPFSGTQLVVSQHDFVFFPDEHGRGRPRYSRPGGRRYNALLLAHGHLLLKESQPLGEHPS